LKTRRSAFEKVLHWSLTVSVLSVWFFLEDGGAPHIYVGYLAFVVGLIQLTLAWLHASKKGLSLLSDHPKLAFTVHNLIWAFLAGLSLTGWMMSWDRFWGEDWLERLHENLSWALAVAVVFHLLGLLRDAYKHRRASWLHMVTRIDR